MPVSSTRHARPAAIPVAPPRSSAAATQATTPAATTPSPTIAPTVARRAPDLPDAPTNAPRRAPASGGNTQLHGVKLRGGVDSSATAVARAVHFVDHFHTQLGLRGAALDEKVQVMTTDPHAFFRALPALFVSDLQTTFKAALPLVPGKQIDDGPILVDAHLGNLGTFRNHTPAKGDAVWGPNDYDQVGVGSPEVDLARAATSAALLARALGMAPKKAKHDVVNIFLRAWRDELHEVQKQGPRPPVLEKHEASRAVRQLLDDVHGAKYPLKRYVDHDRFTRSADLVDVPPATARLVSSALAHTLPGVAVLDVVSRLHAGGSSRGLPRFWALVDDKGTRKIIELKQPPPPPATKAFDGERMCRLQRELMREGMSDSVRPCSVGGVSMMTREVEGEKGAHDLAALDEDDLRDLVADAGKVLARAHATSTARATALSTWIDSDLDTAVSRLQHLATSCADHVVRQHSAVCAHYGVKQA